MDESSSTQSKKSSLHGYRILHLNVNSFETIKIIQDAYTSHKTSDCPDSYIINNVNLSAVAQSSNIASTTSNFSNVNINYAVDEKPPHNVKKKNEVKFFSFFKFKKF